MTSKKSIKFGNTKEFENDFRKHNKENLEEILTTKLDKSLKKSEKENKIPEIKEVLRSYLFVFNNDVHLTAYIREIKFIDNKTINLQFLETENLDTILSLEKLKYKDIYISIINRTGCDLLRIEFNLNDIIDIYPTILSHDSGVAIFNTTLKIKNLHYTKIPEKNKNV